jgi:ankyrin repeat protein
VAAEKGHVAIVEALLEKGKANVNAMSHSKWTALTKAAKGGNVDVVNFLIEKGATRNPTPYDDWEYVRWDKKLSLEAREEILEVVRC